MADDVLGIVVVNFASADLIERCLGPVDLPGAQIVIVDNRSTDAERRSALALAKQHDWDLVLMPDNRGFGAGVNAGVRRAAELGATCYLLLNPDTIVSAETVDELRGAVIEAPGALVSPRLVDEQGRITFAGSVLDLRDGRVSSQAKWKPTPDRLPWLTAACLAVHSDLWRSAGGFDETYFMYWEDVDFSERCRRVGATMVLRDDLVVVHDQGGTQGARRGRAKSSLYYYYNARNRMIYATRWLDRRGIRRWLWHTPAVTLEIFLRGGRRQLIESPGRAWAAVSGGGAAMLRGFAALPRARR